MAQKIKQGNIFGRIGSGVGKGLAEQIPKEIDRSRLASGLKDLAAKKDLTPFERMAEFYSIPGAADRPELIRSGTEFLKHQSMSNIFSGEGVGGGSANQNPEKYIPKPEDFRQAPEASPNKSLTTKEGVQSTIHPVIPPTYEKQVGEARDLMNKNPGLDFPQALEAIQNKYNQQQKINAAEIAERDLRQDVQTKTENELKNEIATLVGGNNSKIPGDVLSKLQSDAIADVRDGKLSEKDAAKEYGKKALQIDKQYSDAYAIGDKSLIFKNPKQVANAINGLRKQFKSRNDQHNLAKTFISENGFSPAFAYSKAYDMADTPKLNAAIQELPKIGVNLGFIDTIGKAITGIPDTQKKQKSLQVAKKLAPLLDKESSPLAVYEALDSKGYDPEVWISYLIDNQDQLNLTLNQVDELTKSKGAFQGMINDLWIKAFGG